MRSNQILVGKTVDAIWLADDQMAIKFDIRDGESIIARTDGDCCSHSWIENVENPEAIVGSPVTAVEDIDMPDQVGGEDEYGLKIETQKGTCVIDYRNSSNGYYGGNLSWPDDIFYGGVYGQNISSEEWNLLTRA